LSIRDVEEMLAERGVEGGPRHGPSLGAAFTPLLADAAQSARNAAGDRWLLDETYVKVGGRWRYLYRAVDQFGQVIDVLLSTRRDGTARRFFPGPMTATRSTGHLTLTLVPKRNPECQAIERRFDLR